MNIIVSQPIWPFPSSYETYQQRWHSPTETGPHRFRHRLPVRCPDRRICWVRPGRRCWRTWSWVFPTYWSTRTRCRWSDWSGCPRRYHRVRPSSGRLASRRTFGCPRRRNGRLVRRRRSMPLVELRLVGIVERIDFAQHSLWENKNKIMYNNDRVEKQGFYLWIGNRFNNEAAAQQHQQHVTSHGRSGHSANQKCNVNIQFHYIKPLHSVLPQTRSILN